MPRATSLTHPSAPPRKRVAPPSRGVLTFLVLAVLSIPFYRLLTVEVGPFFISSVDALTVISGIYVSAMFLMGRPLAWPRGRFQTFLALYIFAVAASGLGALDQGRSLHYLAAVLLNLVLFTVTFQCMRTPRTLEILSRSYCLACLLLAVVALAQGLRMLEGGPLVSATGTLGSRNEMIYFLLPGFAIAAGNAMGRGWKRFGYLLVAGVLLAAILVSRGRAGVLLCLGVGFVAPILTSGSRRGVRVLEPLALWGLLALLGLALVSISGSGELVERYLHSIQTEFREQRGSVWARYEVLRGAWNAFTSHPIFGIGADNFALASGVYVDAGANVGQHDFAAIQPHNSYVGALAETGIAGFVGLLGLLSAGLSGLGAVRRAPLDQRPLLAGVVLAFLVLIVDLAVFDGVVRPVTWLFLALALAAREIAPPPRHRPLVLDARS
ncbi:MAG TPA: O-antigen ligase family protein [Planctomycetes bacterium]|nr:O-antigen ligase family protein [Planctomycetota bacterium]